MSAFMNGYAVPKCSFISSAFGGVGEGKSTPPQKAEPGEPWMINMCPHKVVCRHVVHAAAVRAHSLRVCLFDHQHSVAGAALALVPLPFICSCL
jgi:hypothetical protein